MINMSENNEKFKFITLKDGRKLSYIEFGDPEGKSIFYFHGHPSSRLELSFFVSKMDISDIHLIAVDRPGMGFSDFKKGYAILDWPDDIIELANSLKIEKFAVIGGSGGGPYVSACAYKIPDRLTCCGIISGIGPVDMGIDGMKKSNRRDLFISKYLPWINRLMLWIQNSMMKKLAKKDDEEILKMFKKMAKDLPDPDKNILTNPKYTRFAFEMMYEAFRGGINGIVNEVKLFANDWGFNLQDISPTLKIFLWHGDLDVNVPVSMGHKVCEAIPNCTGKFFPEEGHFSMFLNHFAEIVKTITDAS